MVLQLVLFLTSISNFICAHTLSYIQLPSALLLPRFGSHKHPCSPPTLPFYL